MADDFSNKRQRTNTGYKSTSNSASNTGVYNSDNDDGDELLANFVPDTPSGLYQTQPTQIIDPNPPVSSPSAPATPSHHVVQVPASSPFTGRDTQSVRASPTNKPGSRANMNMSPLALFKPGPKGPKLYSGPIQQPNTAPRHTGPYRIGPNNERIAIQPTNPSLSPHFTNGAGQNGSPKALHMLNNNGLAPGGSRTAMNMPAGQQGGGGMYRPVSNGFGGQITQQNLASSMAPAGTAYRPPLDIQPKPPTSYIIDDEGPKYQGGSSDEEFNASAGIKHTNFGRTSANSSFGASPANHQPTAPNGNAKFMSTVQGAYYQPQQQQTRPDRARPLQNGQWSDERKIANVQGALPHYSQQQIRNALLLNNWDVDSAVTTLGRAPSDRAAQYQKSPHVIDLDSGDDSPKMLNVPEPQMKRGLQKPAQSIRDKWSSTQQFAPRPVAASTPPKPKRRLVAGRRDPSSPAVPIASSPLKPASPIVLDDYDSDSGVASEPEEDPRLESRVLAYLNKCSVKDLIELTNIKQDIAEIMINARPFSTLDAARCVENTKTLKSGKKSTRAPVGDRIVDNAMEMFTGYEAMDTLVDRCKNIGEPLAAEMMTWGFDVFGQKNGELEMVSFEDNESQRDSGVGSPTSGTASNNGKDDDEVKSIPKRKANINFLKKPEMMADTCLLKDYQVVGLNWLALMYRKKLSGILADEMGLGKTCQVIAFLTHLVETGHSGPHLVVCPASTLENWLREFVKFSPGLAVEPYHGLQKDRAEMGEAILENRDRVNVVVTTYEMASNKNDAKFMRKLNADCCVYDEGHMLKNVKSQRYQGLMKIPSSFRLLLTGTPLQNNLQELSALLAFILPDVFKELEEDLAFIFKARATTSDSNHAALLSAQRISRARSMLTPFVLRRKKDQVMKDLPPKTGRVEYCTMTKDQKEIYDGHLEQARERARITLEGGKSPKIDENNSIMQLRKAAISHLLFRRHFTDAKVEKICDILRKKLPEFFDPTQKREHLINEMRAMSDYKFHIWCLLYPCIKQFDIPDLAWMNSGKVESMLKLVKQYKENGDRVLIFSQFTLVLDILEAVLNTSLISFTRIDGSTSINERQSLIDAYTEDEGITAFLLTTKAGGTGINLMCANKVIIFDGSFNPQDDRQAENRAHRVGQVRPVEVVRLVTRGTIEEQIYALGQSKLNLDSRVAGEDDEAGEKAVLKMMIDGTGVSKDGEGASDEAKKDVGAKEEVGKGTGENLPQRKKASLISELTASQKFISPSDEDDGKPGKIDE